MDEEVIEIKDLIRTVLTQMAEIKHEEYKKSYLVEDIEFELSLSRTREGKIGAKLFGIGGNLNAGIENNQKVKIKLKPKTVNQDMIEISI